MFKAAVWQGHIPSDRPSVAAATLSTPAMLQVSGLVKNFGGLRATDNVDFEVRGDEVHAVIGPNGAGKTTFISLLSGELRADEGSIRFGGVELTGLGVAERARLGLGRSYQISQIFRDMTALQNVILAVQATEPHCFSFIKPVHKDDGLIDNALQSLQLCGLGKRADVMVSAMAHGEHRQLELAMALATQPKMLLLDEPMAGMSQGESIEMIALLKQLKQQFPMVLVEHDMDAVFTLADRVSVLVYGRVVATGTPDEIRNDPLVKEAYLGDQDEF